jgi:hypothetical protein
MAKGLEAPRDDISEYAPRYVTMKINPDKIREVIGKGGETIRGITEKTGAQVNIDDEGFIAIAPDAYGPEMQEEMLRYSLTIEVQSIDGIQNNVAVTAKIEGLAGSGLSSEWTKLESSGAAEEELAVAYGDERLEIGFNAKYLLEIASQVDRENAVFLFNSSGDPTLMREGNDMSAVYVVMPMRV